MRQVYKNWDFNALNLSFNNEIISRRLRCCGMEDRVRLWLMAAGRQNNMWRGRGQCCGSWPPVFFAPPHPPFLSLHYLCRGSFPTNCSSKCKTQTTMSILRIYLYKVLARSTCKYIDNQEIKDASCPTLYRCCFSPEDLVCNTLIFGLCH